MTEIIDKQLKRQDPIPNVAANISIGSGFVIRIQSWRL